MSFGVNRAFAKEYGDRWVILSAKYGFILPSFVIPAPYEVTFKDRKTLPIGLDDLRRQVQALMLREFDRIISLGGSIYRDVVKAAFIGFDGQLQFPTAGLPLGGSMQFLKNYNPRKA